MIPKEQQTAYQRWEMTSFGDERPSTLARQAAENTPAAPAAPEVDMPTQAECDAIRLAAHDQGYDQGHAEGLEAGHAAGYAEALEEQVFELVQMASGRSLVLFTSYAMLNRIHEKLSKRLPFNILKQGDAPRGQLLERFREDVSSVLFATGSFWQGVDVMGEALSCVIIDKLPFEPPNDPVVEARIEYLRKQGRNPFAEFQIPTAVIQLKQGIGRLIRDVDDWGVAAIFDKRMLSKSYVRKFMKSLPPGRILHSLDKVRDWWDEKRRQEQES